MNNSYDLPTARPESVGIPPDAIQEFLDHIEINSGLNPHSILMLRHGKLVFEAYWNPFIPNRKHRMYSCTKSFVSLAIGCLADEGKLSLDDPVVKYFPDKLPSGNLHPYIAEATIRHLLMMSTPYSSTTYQNDDFKNPDWVETFFTTEPTHRPGCVFSYDTSATHTLGALVERLTGMSFLDYLRPRLLDPLGVAPDTTCIKDPSGIAWGGSGLLCRPRDFAKVALTCLQGGSYQGRQLLPEWYVKEATSKQIDNFLAGNSPDEQQGYGYQFWRCRNNGFAFHGMGCQMGICLPDKDFLLVTTMDNQWKGNTHHLVYNGLWRLLYPRISDGSLSMDDGAYKKLCLRVEGLSLPVAEGADDSPVAKAVSGKTYSMDENPMRMNTLRFDFTIGGGSMSYEIDGALRVLSFNYGRNLEQRFPEHVEFPIHEGGEDCVISAAWVAEDTLNLRVLFIDDEFGELRITACFRGDTVTVNLKRAAEFLIRQYGGMFSGSCYTEERKHIH